jgi:hypothetical protein
MDWMGRDVMDASSLRLEFLDGERKVRQP